MKISNIEHTKVSVLATDTAVLSANSERNFLLLVNDSGGDIYIKFGDTAVMNEGIRIPADGGSLLMDVLVPTSSVRAITAITGKDLLVTEA